MKAKQSFLVPLLLLSCLYGNASASTITSNGDGTFTDTTTGYSWMDVSTFYGQSYAQDQSSLLPGYVFATLAQMQQLATDTGITSSTTESYFDTVGAAMGAPQPDPLGRYLIWGYYGDGSSWAYTYGPDSGYGVGWRYETNTTTNTDIGAFAIKASVAPLPGALPLFVSGLGALGLLSWRRKKKTAALAA